MTVPAGNPRPDLEPRHYFIPIGRGLLDTGAVLTPQELDVSLHLLIDDVHVDDLRALLDMLSGTAVRSLSKAARAPS